MIMMNRIKWIPRLSLVLGLICMVMAASASETVLIYRVDQANFTETSRGLTDELKGRAKVVDEAIGANDELGYADFKAKVVASNPAVLVVMENRLVNLAKQLVQDPDPKVKGVKVVATMGINLKVALKGVPRTCGVGYEVAPYSIVSGLNGVTSANVGRVLIVYRKSVFNEYVTDAARQLERAGIKVVAVDAEGQGADADAVEGFLKKNLMDLAKDDKIDAVVVMGDNALLNKKTMPIWLKASQKSGKPFVTGIDMLVDRKMDFCVYAASPNHYELGIQVAQMAGQILEDDADPATLGVEYPVRMQQKIDKAKLKKLKVDLRGDRPKGILGDD